MLIGGSDKYMQNIFIWNEDNLFESLFLGNSLMTWIIAIAVFVIIFGGLKVVKNLLISRLNRLNKEKNSAFIEVATKAIDAIRWPFFKIAAVYIALDILDTHVLVQQWVYYAFITLAVYYGIKAISILVEFWSAKAIENKNEADHTKVKFLTVVVKVFLYISAVLLLLTNFGYDVTSLLAGLGIGGIAIALASQQILADVIGAFTVYFDKPFKIGDHIIVAPSTSSTLDFAGVVTKIGIRSTRLKGVSGEEIIIANKDIASARIKNLSV
jgi:small-conductance mechanosensitive channel